ncbi:MAG: 4Fe-4S dicluster domain-containing protein [Candidatus Edwardsbacteria bacterium]
MKIGAMFPELTRHLFKKPATVKYPFEKLSVPKGFRGTPIFNSSLCIGCLMCVRDCPSESIEIIKLEEKKFKIILYLDRCTHCGQCEESCLKKAITLNSDFEVAAFSKGDLKLEQV